MSYKVHRAMGWGIPWKVFCGATSLKLDEGGDVLEDAFNAKGKLIVPEDVMHASWERTPGKPRPLPMLSPFLTSKKFVGSKEPPPDSALERTSELFVVAWNGDNEMCIIFFPNVSERQKWYRYDNDMDYLFEQWRKDFGSRRGGERYNDMSIRGRQMAPRDDVLYLPYGPYPWGNCLMDATTGEPVEWVPFTEVEKHPEWVPGVPAEIRWYLNHLGILDDSGVNKLRPCIAQWWS